METELRAIDDTTSAQLSKMQRFINIIVLVVDGNNNNNNIIIINNINYYSLFYLLF